MPGKCAFREDWMTSDKDLGKWLRPVSQDKYKAFCIFCKSKFDVSHSGIGSVKSHQKAKRHQDLACSILTGKQSMLNFPSFSSHVAPSSNATNSNPGPSQENAVAETSKECEASVNTLTLPAPSTTMNSFIINEEVLKAEVLWSLNRVMSHTSDRSTCKGSDLFAVMFPDSVIAQKFQMHKDKLGYVCCYGLGPYFQNLLCRKLMVCDFFCISIDESLNKISQKGQMDLIVRYFDTSINSVVTQYLTSTFLGHSTAVDMLNAFTQTLSELNIPLLKIMQICTDGPNVNIKFLNDFQALMKDQEKSEAAHLLNVGVCCLHIIHGAYKTAHDKSGWNINKFLRAIYFLFKDFPSRRADYTHHSGSALFPLKMCSVRWIENSNVIDRALKILPNIRKYVDGVKGKPPSSNNFHYIKEFLNDKLLPAKLAFLQSIAFELEPFLTIYQADKPLLPFLYDDCISLMCSVANRFLKKEVLTAAKSGRDLISLDVEKVDNQLLIGKIDIGFGAKRAIKDLDESIKLSFRRDCKKILINLYMKLAVKSPASIKLVKGASCLAPSIMLRSDTIKSNRISIALDVFLEKNFISVSEAEIVKKTYLALCNDAHAQEKLKSFDKKNNRLDVFMEEIVKENQLHIGDLTKFLGFCQKIFCLFHGNAAVERGFSINKECIVENMQEQSLISQRSIQSAVHNLGGVLNVELTKSLLMSVKSASSRRKQALQEKRKRESEKEDEAKRAKDKLKELKQKKMKLMQQTDEEVQALDIEISKTKKHMLKLM